MIIGIRCALIGSALWLAVAGVSAQQDDNRVQQVQALRAQSKALKKPQQAEARQLFSSAFKLFQEGDFATAKIAFERGLGADPGNGMARYWLAETLMRLKDSAGAEEQYALAKELLPATSAESLKAETALNKFVAARKAEGGARQARLKLEMGQQSEVARVAGEQRNARDGAARGLQWAESDNGADIDWNEANAYCASKGSGWRLPTVAELQSNYQSGLSTKCGRWTCNVASKSRLTGPYFWTSELNGSSEAWVVDLDDGTRVAYRVVTRSNSRALCTLRL